MLTQSMPALTKALTGLIPPAAIRQLTQALGNCNQEVVQRGNVTMQPAAWTNANNGYGRNGINGINGGAGGQGVTGFNGGGSTGGNYNNGSSYGGPGTYTGNAWSPANYNQLFNNPYTVNNNAYDLRTQIDQAGNTFYNSTNSFQDFFNATSVNNYGGDVTNIGGNMIWGDTIINENPGSPGQAGRRGESGIDGLNGYDGFDGYDGEAGINGLNGGDGMAGASGPQGLPGNAGGNGLNGAGGTAGYNGSNGYDGFNGNDGSNGGNGLNGGNGNNGVDGRNGFGFRGAGGAAGQPGAAGVNGVNGWGQNGLNGIGFNGAAGRNGMNGMNGMNAVGVDMRVGKAWVGGNLLNTELTLEATVPKYAFDSTTCSLIEDGTDKVKFTPKCKQPLKKLIIKPQQKRFFGPNGP